MKGFHFSEPLWLLLSLLPLFWFIWYLFIFPSRRLRIAVSYDPNRFGGGSSIRSAARLLPVILKNLAILCWILALSRPQSVGDVFTEEKSASDILLLIDVSASMETEDIKPTRLKAAQLVAGKFISQRTDDRIGIILFAEDAFSYTPLTHDTKFLIQQIEDIYPGILPKNGTALGSAIATGINRVRNAGSASKVMIILTDGAGNRGEIDPITAAQLTTEYGIRIYTVGIGREEFTVKDPVKGIIQQKTDLDEPLLREIAGIGSGKFFRATDAESLEAVFNEIHQLEKSIFQTESDRIAKEEYPTFIIAGLIFFCLALILQALNIYNPLEE
jgi:Ca-activated chloride channel homolog